MKKTDFNQFKDGFVKLILFAWEDEAFKEQLRSDPIKTFEENGVALPDDIDPNVIRNIPESGVLDPPPGFLDGEIPDSQLENVSGGQLIGESIEDCLAMALVGLPCDLGE